MLFRIIALCVAAALAVGCASTSKFAALDQTVVDTTLQMNAAIASRSAPLDLAKAAGTNKALASPVTEGYCGLVWDHDEGAYGVMRATRSTTVNVNNIRNGRVVGGLTFTLNTGDLLSLLQNSDGLNYDGYNCE